MNDFVQPAIDKRFFVRPVQGLELAAGAGFVEAYSDWFAEDLFNILREPYRSYIHTLHGHGLGVFVVFPLPFPLTRITSGVNKEGYVPYVLAPDLGCIYGAGSIIELDAPVTPLEAAQSAALLTYEQQTDLLTLFKLYGVVVAK